MNFVIYREIPKAIKAQILDDGMEIDVVRSYVSIVVQRTQCLSAFLQLQ